MPQHRARLASAGLLVALLACLVSIPILARSETAFESNPPVGRTGAPGESTCNACHTGALDDAQGTLTLSGVPAMYLPGQTYTLMVSLARAGQQRWGFEITSLFTSDDTYAGTLAATNAFTGDDTTPFRGYVFQAINTGADGTYEGIVGGPVSWTFDWTAPAAGGGTVRFYVVGVAANGDGAKDSGDLVYTNHDVTSDELPTTATTETSTTWGWIKSHYR